MPDPLRTGLYVQAGGGVKLTRQAGIGLRASQRRCWQVHPERKQSRGGAAMRGPTWKGMHLPLLFHSSRSKVGAALRKKLSLPRLGIGPAALCLPISLLPVVSLLGGQGWAFASNRGGKIPVRSESRVWGLPHEESKLSDPLSF